MDFPMVGRYTERAGLALTPEVKQRVKAIVKQHDSTMSAVLRGLIEAGLEVYEKEQQQ